MRASTRLEHSESSHTHNSSEPSCDDHTAVAREKTGVVVLEWPPTRRNVKSERRNAASRIVSTSAST